MRTWRGRQETQNKETKDVLVKKKKWSDMKNILYHYFLLKIGWIEPKKHFTLLSL
jgi:hypothetical protein